MNQFVQPGSGWLRGRWFWLASAAALLVALRRGAVPAANIYGEGPRPRGRGDRAGPGQPPARWPHASDTRMVGHRGHLRAHLVWVECLGQPMKA